MPAFQFSTHDSYPREETALVDNGLGSANALAASLQEVQPISCFARTRTGEVVGGAVGRWWGKNCELQQLWVDPAHRRKGLGSRLIRAFEAHAASHGCSSFSLETFSFQAPPLYAALGYKVAYEHKLYPHDIVKFVMVKHTKKSQDDA